MAAAAAGGGQRQAAGSGWERAAYTCSCHASRSVSGIMSGTVSPQIVRSVDGASVQVRCSEGSRRMLGRRAWVEGGGREDSHAP